MLRLVWMTHMVIAKAAFHVREINKKLYVKTFTLHFTVDF